MFKTIGAVLIVLGFFVAAIGYLADISRNFPDLPGQMKNSQLAAAGAIAMLIGTLLFFLLP